MIDTKSKTIYLEFCKDVVYDAGQLLLQIDHETRQIKSKSTSIDLVTDADERIQNFIVQRIRERFPDHSILAEEDTETGLNEHELVWVIDPIDGTTNFWHRLPYFTVTVALCIDAQPEVGVIYAPRLNDMFWAARGEGAFNQAGPISVSTIRDMHQAVIATGFPYERAPGCDNNLAEFSRVMPYVQGIRRFGAASLDLAYVAAGLLDGYWEFHLRPWDSMAGILLVDEAGGQVSTVRPTGEMNGAGGILATNGLLHTILHRHITDAV